AAAVVAGADGATPRTAPKARIAPTPLPRTDTIHRISRLPPKGRWSPRASPSARKAAKVRPPRPAKAMASKLVNRMANRATVAVGAVVAADAAGAAARM